MASHKRLWIVLGLAVAGAFAVLGLFGREVYRQAPPIPERVVTESGRTLMTRDDILSGQQVWQTMGGQQVGSIWGHGAYQAPDWTADWLHRELVALLDLWSRRQHGQPYDALGAEQQAALRGRLSAVVRANRYDPATGTVTVTEDRALAMAQTATHYDGLFGGAAQLAGLRESYALSDAPVPNPERRKLLADFYSWTAWAASTERPGSTATYTNNWPHEPLIGNVPTGPNVLWSVLSVVVLLAGVGALVWWKAFRDREEELPPAPAADPLDRLKITPSMKAVGKYGVVVVALLAAQVLLGALLAHYTVQGQSFFGIRIIGEVLPYAVVRTWHLQLAVFWIATAFLAIGLFLAPAIGGKEPRHQRLGVNILFGALLLVVVGSLAGEWLAIQNRLGDGVAFWFGHQGYEYVDLGRGWQVALYGGLFLWLFLVARALLPALRVRDDRRQILFLLTASVVAIGLLYGAGLMYGARTHLSVMEYWRWWVVHLWVEGFFEVFATAAIAFLFARMGLVRPGSATRAALFTATLYLAAGIPGTFHHLYFSGTPVSIMAVGASFSALEVVPLVLVGFEAFHNLQVSRAAGWMRRYKWPLTFFLGATFWNLVGAGLFGFLINPPIALYYMQGLNTTPVHGHAALFGVYGLLALGLVLLVLRRLRPGAEWDERPLKLAFWAMNIGLALMIGLSLLPVGIAQALASMETGLWYARSAEFLQQPLLEKLRWMRMVGDTIFIAGVGGLCWFTLSWVRGRFPTRALEELPVENEADDAVKRTA